MFSDVTITLKVLGSPFPRCPKEEASLLAHRVYQRAVDQPVTVDALGLEAAGQRQRGPHGVNDLAVAQPDFVAGPQIRGDGDKGCLQLVHPQVTEIMFGFAEQPGARNHAAIHRHFQIPQHSHGRKAARPFFQNVGMAGQVKSANQRADRASRDDIGDQAQPVDRLQHAQMGPAARDAATQCQTNANSRHTISVLGNCDGASPPISRINRDSVGNGP
jgi:hypothetical protein